MQVPLQILKLCLHVVLEQPFAMHAKSPVQSVSLQQAAAGMQPPAQIL
jgi:hypothetical protein